MRNLMMALTCVLALALTSAAQETWHAGKSAEENFAAGGTISLQLGAGDATVEIKSDAKQIRVTTEGQREDELKKAEIKIKVSGTTAVVRVSGPHNHFRYRVEIPSAAQLKIRMSAGDLAVNGVDGTADIALHAGDCNIKLGAPAADFGNVNLSVKAGDISADPFQASKGGLFRHFHMTRAAKYRLDAHVGAGDLNVK